MTAAVEGLMTRIGFGGFTAETIWSWLLVLVVFAVFTAFIVALVTGILMLYNLLSERTGAGLRSVTGIGAADAQPAIGEPVGDATARDSESDRSYDELYAEAQRRKIPGRSSMTEAQLRAALRRRPRRRAASAKSR